MTISSVIGREKTGFQYSTGEKSHRKKRINIKYESVKYQAAERAKTRHKQGKRARFLI